MTQFDYGTASRIVSSDQAFLWGVEVAGDADAAVVNIRNGPLVTSPIIFTIKTPILTTVPVMLPKSLPVLGLYLEVLSGTTPATTVFFHD